jgi:hypothetical protein
MTLPQQPQQQQTQGAGLPDTGSGWGGCLLGCHLVCCCLPGMSRL